MGLLLSIAPLLKGKNPIPTNHSFIEKLIWNIEIAFRHFISNHEKVSIRTPLSFIRVQLRKPFNKPIFVTLSLASFIPAYVCEYKYVNTIHITIIIHDSVF